MNEEFLANMTVITFNFGISSYSDGTSVASNLSNYFGFTHMICIEKEDNVERIENTWKGCKLTILDHFNEVEQLKYRDMEACEMPPLSRELVEKLSFHRCHLNSMHRDEYLSFRELDQQLLHFFEYWNYFINEYDIQLALFNGIPHAVCTYTLYALCKVRGIKTIFVARSCVPGYSFCNDEVFEKYERMEMEYKKALESSKDIQLSEFMQEYYVKRMEDGTFKTPATYKMSFALEKEARNKKVILGKVARRFFKIHNWKRYWKWARRMHDRVSIPKKTEKYYRKLSCPADYSAKFIYVPLHMQPEMTTSPNGNVYVNLYLMVKTIAFSVKDTDIQVYVKEHADQRKGFRLSRRELYDQLKTIPNVKLINIEESTFKLQDHCVATATCSGTVIMETLFKYKPILVFGNYINSLAPNTYIVRDTDSCRAAIDNIVEGGFSIGKRQRDAFLKAVEKSGFRGYVRTEYAPDYWLTQDENTENIFTEFKQIIGEWLNKKDGVAAQ